MHHRSRTQRQRYSSRQHAVRDTHSFMAVPAHSFMTTAPSRPAPPREFTRAEARRLITNAYYDCRNEGLTMEAAADRAADEVWALYLEARPDHPDHPAKQQARER
jgi:hypothetical protein